MSRVSIARAIGASLLSICSTVAVLRAVLAEHPAPERRLSQRDLEAVGRIAAMKEPEWRAKARKSFPGDHWSQDDDFHASERYWVLDEARRREVPIADVLRAIDEDLHARPPAPPRKATAAPSKPRPFYD